MRRQSNEAAPNRRMSPARSAAVAQRWRERHRGIEFAFQGVLGIRAISSGPAVTSSHGAPSQRLGPRRERAAVRVDGVSAVTHPVREGDRFPRAEG